MMNNIDKKSISKLNLDDEAIKISATEKSSLSLKSNPFNEIELRFCHNMLSMAIDIERKLNLNE